MRYFRLGAFAGLASLCTACQDDRGPVSVRSHDPDLKIVAIKRDLACPNHEQLAQLVEDLESDDPAIRFYSIQALQRVTRDDFGYLFYQDEDRRKPAVKKWQEWMKFK